jgi:hypothetical protein
VSAAAEELETPDVREILADPASSKWIKASLESALKRDPVDALNDALVLAAVLEARLRSELGILSS